MLGRLGLQVHLGGGGRGGKMAGHREMVNVGPLDQACARLKAGDAYKYLQWAARGCGSRAQH